MDVAINPGLQPKKNLNISGAPISGAVSAHKKAASSLPSVGQSTFSQSSPKKSGAEGVLETFLPIFTQASKRISQKSIEKNFLVSLSSHVNKFLQQCNSNKIDPSDVFANTPDVDIVLIKDLGNIGAHLKKLNNKDFSDSSVSGLSTEHLNSLIEIFKSAERASTQNKFEANTIWRALEESNISKKLFLDVKKVKDKMENLQKIVVKLHQDRIFIKGSDMNNTAMEDMKALGKYDQGTVLLLKKLQDCLGEIETLAEAEHFKKLASEYNITNDLLKEIDDRVFMHHINEHSKQIMIGGTLDSSEKIALDKLVAGTIAHKDRDNISSVPCDKLPYNDFVDLYHMYAAFKKIKHNGSAPSSLKQIWSHTKVSVSNHVDYLESVLTFIKELKHIKDNVLYKQDHATFLKSEEISRENLGHINEALKKLRNENGFPEDVFNFILEESEITQEEIERMSKIAVKKIKSN